MEATEHDGADALHLPALDLDDHHAEVGMRQHHLCLAVSRLDTGALLEPRDVR